MQNRKVLKYVKLDTDDNKKKVPARVLAKDIYYIMSFIITLHNFGSCTYVFSYIIMYYV